MNKEGLSSDKSLDKQSVDSSKVLKKSVKQKIVKSPSKLSADPYKTLEQDLSEYPSDKPKPKVFKKPVKQKIDKSPSKLSIISSKVSKKLNENKKITKISLTLFFIGFLILGAMAYEYSRSPEKQLKLGADIESVLISQDGKTSYIKLKAGSFEEITKVKFIFKGEEEYIYSTSEGVKEISIPYKKGFLDWLFGRQFQSIYNYMINIVDLNLDDFRKIDEVDVVFEYKTKAGEEIITPVLDTQKPIVTTRTMGSGGGGGSSSGGGGGGGSGSGSESGGGGCSPSKTCANYPRQCGTGLSDGCNDNLDCSNNCGNESYCYTEEGVATNICIDNSITCVDSDGLDYSIKGNVTTNTFVEDECLNPQEITEYYCYYNDNEFEARSETGNCENGCLDGRCLGIVCLDNNECDDNLFCNGEEICNPVFGCQSRTPIDCNDSISCTVDSCNENADNCDNTPDDNLCPDNTCYEPICSKASGCNEIAVANGGNDESCQSPDYCDGSGTCVSDSVCGNNIIESGETCDGTDLNGNDCTTLGLGFTGGTLACLGDCFDYDTTECTDGKTGTCNDDTDCNSNICGQGICNLITGECGTNYSPSTEICRASAGICDVAETCTGDSLICPTDSFEPNETPCITEESILNRLIAFFQSLFGASPLAGDPGVCQSGQCVPTCIPQTCLGLGYECETYDDGCGNTLDCGTCGVDDICSNHQCIPVGESCSTDIECDDGDSCTQDTCDTNINKCFNSPLDPDNSQDCCSDLSHPWTANGAQSNCCGDDSGEDSPYEITERSCSDESDNDCDGDTDRADSDCAGSPLLDISISTDKNNYETDELISLTSSQTIEASLSKDAIPSNLERIDSDLRTGAGLPEYVGGEVIVKFKEKIDIQEKTFIRKVGAFLKNTVGINSAYIESDKNSIDKLLDKHEAKGSEKVFEPTSSGIEDEFDRFIKLKVKDTEKAIKDIEKDINVEYAVPNYISYVSLTPNDALYSEQWAHQITEAEAGWDIETGDSNIVIAIIDTGVHYTHEDLSGNMLGDCTDGCPTGTGYDFVHLNLNEYNGWKFYPDEDYTFPDNNPSDYHGHGTHCAGIASAITNNGIGVAGVCQNCKIMPVRAGFAIIHPIFGGVGVLEDDDIVNAIKYAADNGADVISMSFGGPTYKPLTENIVNYAHSKGVTLVAAAGNSRHEFVQSTKSYPASYDNVISVAATAIDDTKTFYSYFGPWIDVAAPGGDSYKDSMILSTVPKVGILNSSSGYKSLQGTSMAAPYVAGLVGLILSKNPSFTNEEIRTILKQSADPLSNSDYYVGAGRVNVEKAVQIDSLPNIMPEIVLPTNKASFSSKDTIDIIASAEGSSYTLSYGQGVYPNSWTEIESGLIVNNKVNTQWIPSSLSGEYAIKRRKI